MNVLMVNMKNWDEPRWENLPNELKVTQETGTWFLETAWGVSSKYETGPTEKSIKIIKENEKGE